MRGGQCDGYTGTGGEWNGYYDASPLAPPLWTRSPVQVNVLPLEQAFVFRSRSAAVYRAARAVYTAAATCTPIATSGLRVPGHRARRDANLQRDAKNAFQCRHAWPSERPGRTLEAEGRNVSLSGQ